MQKFSNKTNVGLKLVLFIPDIITVEFELCLNRRNSDKILDRMDQ